MNQMCPHTHIYAHERTNDFDSIGLKQPKISVNISNNGGCCFYEYVVYMALIKNSVTKCFIHKIIVSHNINIKHYINTTNDIKKD